MIEVVAWFLIAAAIADWGAALVLVRNAAKRPPIRFLSAVAVASVLGALGTTALLPLAIDTLTPDDLVSQPHRLGLLVAGVLLFSVPGPAFLLARWLGFFATEDPER